MAIHLGFPRAFVDTHFSGWLSWFWEYRWEWSSPQSLYFLEHPFFLMVADKHRGGEVVLWGRWIRGQEGSAVPVGVFRFEYSDLCSLSWDDVSVTYVAAATKYLATVTQGRRGLVWLMVQGMWSIVVSCIRDGMSLMQRVTSHPQSGSRERPMVLLKWLSFGPSNLSGSFPLTCPSSSLTERASS